jgi:hypothetical protein
MFSDKSIMIVGTVATVISTVVSIAVVDWRTWFNPKQPEKVVANVDVPVPAEPALKDSVSPRLMGTWHVVSTAYIGSMGKMVQTGRIRLSETGEYNFSGDMTVPSGKGQQPSTVTLSALATGTWRSLGNKLILTLHDLKNSPMSPVKLESIIPKGSQQAYTLLDVSDSRFRATGTDIKGVPIFWEATRE